MLGFSAEKTNVYKLTGGHHALWEREAQAETQRAAGQGGHHRGQAWGGGCAGSGRPAAGAGGLGALQGFLCMSETPGKPRMFL